MTRYRERREAGEFLPENVAWATQTAAGELDSMTKEELIELARARGISPANRDMTKEELKEALEAG
jgi:branched-subunit amino acid aminotransferase/4-amino-4-deoxychorismate lyase